MLVLVKDCLFLIYLILSNLYEIIQYIIPDTLWQNNKNIDHVELNFGEQHCL